MKNKPTTNWRRGHPGLTIVELIAGLGIIGFIILMIASVYLAHTRLFSNQNTSIEVATQNRIAVDEITNQIRESQTVASTCSSCAGDTTTATSIILQLWPLNANGEPFEPAASAYDYIVYKRNSADNTKLIKKTIVDPGSLRKSDQKIIAVDISNLQFTYEPDNNNPPTATTVSVSVTTALTSGGKTHTTTQSVKAVLRNK